MKLSRKLSAKIFDLGGKDDSDSEVAPSLYLSHLPGQIPDMPEKGAFEGHIKGHVKRHTATTEGGKTHHAYDLEVHHLECEGKKKRKKPSPRDSVETALERFKEDQDSQK